MSGDYEVAIITSIYSTIVLAMWFIFRESC